MRKLFNKKSEEINTEILSIEKLFVILQPLSIVDNGPVIYPFRPAIQYVKRKIGCSEIGQKRLKKGYPSAKKEPKRRQRDAKK